MPAAPPRVVTEDQNAENSFYPSGLPPTPNAITADDDTPGVDLRTIINVWGVSDDKVRRLRRFHNM